MNGPASNAAAPEGRPTLTEEQCRVARAMAGLGVSRRHIAMHLRIEAAALIAQLGEELELAEVEANSKVAKALFRMATQGNNVAAAIFWMKARGGWRERPDPDASGGDGARAIQVEIVRLSDPARPRPTLDVDPSADRSAP
ncbi:hypothetical protein [Neoroseomonas soli]|uniref:Uncharacterized protein n=1 Tax=Neoroseomonas soli TaxID=1081025 RepID=A0A9X9WTT4_9PROT|nr:hypothetical protein [Neoroseomonas soli]MBR0670563.1 hypothetical protein [Neoroseomonas soli]